ncbi:unnamed protein product [Gongylonema pulchrum]|uniref:Anaphylatoxin-like domain-containing protein n=1 Tax=Gongylonema pulchrum TaxID=637853 RepID=A0A183E5H0_9BILA|nr:unnamed protein product [Gongylonema pulchrum]
MTTMLVRRASDGKSDECYCTVRQPLRTKCVNNGIAAPHCCTGPPKAKGHTECQRIGILKTREGDVEHWGDARRYTEDAVDDDTEHTLNLTSSQA